MQRTSWFVLCLTLTPFLLGCVSHSVQCNIECCQLTPLIQKQIVHKINIGEFTSSRPLLSSIPCRAVGPVRTSTGEPFAHVIRNILIDELKAADRYSLDATTIIRCHLNSIDFDSIDGVWTFTLTVKSTNGAFFTVNESFHYEMAWLGEEGCRQAAIAFIPATLKLLTSLISDSKFQTLLETEK